MIREAKTLRAELEAAIENAIVVARFLKFGKPSRAELFKTTLGES